MGQARAQLLLRRGAAPHAATRSSCVASVVKKCQPVANRSAMNRRAAASSSARTEAGHGITSAPIITRIFSSSPRAAPGGATKRRPAKSVWRSGLTRTTSASRVCVCDAPAAARATAGLNASTSGSGWPSRRASAAAAAHAGRTTGTAAASACSSFGVNAIVGITRCVTSARHSRMTGAPSVDAASCSADLSSPLQLDAQNTSLLCTRALAYRSCSSSL